MSKLVIAAAVALLVTLLSVANQVYMPAIIAPPPIVTVAPTSTATATTQPDPTATQTPTVTPRATTQPAGPCPCAGDTLNCSSFSTQSQAQACMDWCVSQGRGDIHNLDGNADGEACESLPGNFRVVQ